MCNLGSTLDFPTGVLSDLVTTWWDQSLVVATTKRVSVELGTLASE